MKNIVLIFAILLSSSFSQLLAQQKVALHSNGTTTIFEGANPFLDAYNAAVSGDTIYLPGGSIPYPSPINKSLTIIGAGHYPDSTAATGKTILAGSLYISEFADHLWLEGVELTGGIILSNNHKVDSVTITRCMFSGINFMGNGSTPCVGAIIRENVITNSITLTNATSTVVTNNICTSQIINASNAGISNNVLLYNNNTYGIFYNVNNCFISNNIVLDHNGVLTYSDLNTLSNNIFPDVPAIGNNTFVNNYNSVDLTTIFVSQSGNSFNYSHDYHLVSPTTYVGIDGTQIGIYGGMYPYKEAAVPHNPHIQFMNNASSTDSNGDLQIQINVRSQNQ